MSRSTALLPCGLVVGPAAGDDPFDVVEAQASPVVVLGHHDDGGR